MVHSAGANHEPEIENILELDTLSKIGLEIDDNPTKKNNLTMDCIESAQESDMNHVPEVGLPLKKHGLFKVKIPQNTPSASAEFRALDL